MSVLVQRTFRETNKSFEPLLVRAQVTQMIVDQCDVVYDDDALDGDLTDGRFEWVFDIGVRGAAGERAELRFFPASVRARINHLNNPKAVARQWLFDEVFRALFPMGMRQLGGQAVTSTIARAALNCSTELVIALLRAGRIAKFGDSCFRRGNGGGAIITIDSLRTFLESRHTGAAQP